MWPTNATSRKKGWGMTESVPDIDTDVTTLIQINSHRPSMVSSVWDEAFPHQHHQNCFDQSEPLPIFGFRLKFADRHSYQGFRLHENMGVKGSLE
jgi:hypothetical protein